jgi:hypothetical protein
MRIEGNLSCRGSQTWGQGMGYTEGLIAGVTKAGKGSPAH